MVPVFHNAGQLHTTDFAALELQCAPKWRKCNRSTTDPSWRESKYIYLQTNPMVFLSHFSFARGNQRVCRRQICVSKSCKSVKECNEGISNVMRSNVFCLHTTKIYLLTLFVGHDFEQGEALSAYVNFVLCNAPRNIRRVFNFETSHYDIIASIDIKCLLSLCRRCLRSGVDLNMFCSALRLGPGIWYIPRSRECRRGLASQVLILVQKKRREGRRYLNWNLYLYTQDDNT